MTVAAQSRQQRPSDAPSPITATEAAALATRFAQVMELLIEVIEAETQLVRAGQTREATALEPQKTELARQYLADAAQVREHLSYLRRHAPQLLKELQDRHDMFRALLQINMTVLATAHAVTEGLVRGVSGELTRKSQPQTYTAHGCNAAVSASPPPMAVSRQL